MMDLRENKLATDVPEEECSKINQFWEVIATVNKTHELPGVSLD